MSRKIVYSFVVVILILGLGACRGKKNMVKKFVKPSKSEELIQRVAEQELDYNSIEIKYSTRAELSGKKYSLNITYRNKKNELLWVSVRAMLGIEVARLVANRDSVWVISKIGKIKEKGTWKEMSKTLGYPLDFMALQNMLTRRIFYPGRDDNTMLGSFLKRDDGKKVLMVPDFENSEQRKDVASFGFLPQFVINQRTGILNNTRLVPEDNEWMMNVEYQENAEENMGLGKSVLIKAIDSETNIDLDLKIQQVSINQIYKYPFQWF